ncbi:MAG TPA: hypothetical protein VGK67_08615 [Myxococcales bacterium]
MTVDREKSARVRRRVVVVTLLAGLACLFGAATFLSFRRSETLGQWFRTKATVRQKVTAVLRLDDRFQETLRFFPYPGIASRALRERGVEVAAFHFAKARWAPEADADVVLTITGAESRPELGGCRVRVTVVRTLHGAEQTVTGTGDALTAAEREYSGIVFAVRWVRQMFLSSSGESYFVPLYERATIRALDDALFQLASKPPAGK